ncbi:nucleotidyltransferase domain-containing protein [Pyrobaculum sp.]|uniref:nucleotidyltransferase domain-containing protein n=1 Tax=Pyrobaculum sp. TaxID=2004705 RepID=UPI00316785AF
MECREVVPGILKLMECLKGRLGSFSALLTGSWARGESRGALSDVDVLIFAKPDPKAELCCWGLPYECDLIFVEPEKTRRLLEAGFIALLEGLWHGIWICRDEAASAVESAWRSFLAEHEVVRKGDYWVIRKRDRQPYNLAPG